MSVFPKPTAVACAVLAAACAHAQTTTVNLDPMVVTATRFETPLSETLAAVNLITRDQIAASQAASLADLLSGQTGYEFGRNGGPGTVTSFFLRGLNSTNVVVMIDGLRAPIDGIGAISAIDLPLSDIERVEILRGNASALYGDAANGGVIQIFTRRAKEGHALEATAGSRGTKSLHAQLTKVLKDTQLSASITDEHSARNSSQNPDIRKGASSDADASHTRAINLALSQQLSPTSKLRLGLARTEAQVDYDDGNFGFGLETDRHELTRTSDNLRLGLRTEVSTGWRSDVSLGHVTQSIEDRKNGELRTSDWNLGLANSEQTTLRWSNDLALEGDIQVNAGAEVSNESYVSDAILSGYDSTRDTQALFLGLTKFADAASFQANWRFDHIELEDSKRDAQRSWNRHSLAVGAGYDFTPSWRASANISTGFRVPTSYDIAVAPEIRMEKHLSREVSLQYQRDNTLFRATAFWSAVDGLIINHPETYLQTNTDAKSRGIELEGRHQYGESRIRASVVMQNPKNLSIDRQLARRAKSYANVAYERDWSDTTFGVAVHASSKRYDSNFSDTILAGYTTLDLTASRRLSPEWTLRGKLENLFDERYELASGYNTPRRGVFMNLVYQAK